MLSARMSNILINLFKHTQKQLQTEKILRDLPIKQEHSYIQQYWAEGIKIH